MARRAPAATSSDSFLKDMRAAREKDAQAHAMKKELAQNSALASLTVGGGTPIFGHDTPAFGASAPASGVNSARSSQAPSAITSGRASPAFYSPAMHLLEPVEEASDSDDIPLQGDFLAGKAWADDDGEQSSERNL